MVRLADDDSVPTGVLDGERSTRTDQYGLEYFAGTVGNPDPQVKFLMPCPERSEKIYWLEAVSILVKQVRSPPRFLYDHYCLEPRKGLVSEGCVSSFVITIKRAGFQQEGDIENEKANNVNVIVVLRRLRAGDPILGFARQLHDDNKRGWSRLDVWGRELVSSRPNLDAEWPG